ncbi:MAG: damage-inducible protein DinB [Sphingobacteriales bacterium]|nr:MAG: damage-inducible protein DinB [Sphingobacteriales bacterium]
MKNFYIELFQYSNHYNQMLGDLILKYRECVTEKTILLYNHILNAHEIWNYRIRKIPPPVSVWEVRPLESLKAIDHANFEETLSILENLDLSETIAYKTMRGDAFSNKVSDILFHAVNHSTYHRAQIATELKQQGIEPITTDYIFYKR